MKLFQVFVEIFEDYCLNSSLAGMRYLVERRYHFSERIFWFLCVILSWIGSTHLILLFIDDYIYNSVSMGVVSIGPKDTVDFPSIGICESGYMDEINPKLDTFIRDSFSNGDPDNYNFEIEDFLMKSSFVNLYTFNKFADSCDMDCDEGDEYCNACPESGYEKIADIVRSDCQVMFQECKWRDVNFDCCKYFKPVPTTQGKCFLINSIQAVERYGRDWLDMRLGLAQGNGQIYISLARSAELYILSHEDIPHMHLTANRFDLLPQGFTGDFIIKYQDIINEKNLRNVDPWVRKCKFPDETEGTKYKAFSFSVCATECLKSAQVRRCNCSHPNLHHDKHDETTICDLKGLLCLDKHNVMVPRSFVLQPWHPTTINCTCLPSCDEPQVTVVSKSSSFETGKTLLRNATVKILQVPSYRYYRQAVKEKIDIVGELINVKTLSCHSMFNISVSVGGILGLFMGASILSFIEVIFFFTVGSIKKWREYLAREEKRKPTIKN